MIRAKLPARPWRRPVQLGLAVLGVSACSLALAQEAADEESMALEEVVVTGQKIERSLQDTATSVAVFDAGTIDEQNFIGLGDVLNQTANVSTAFNDGVITIRGLRNSGAGAFDNPSDVSAVYVDGVFLPSSLFTSGA
ncbi:MAG: TonB-dependent receptor plug domain-containing protein, partial [Pseudomonadota bacterium]